MKRFVIILALLASACGSLPEHKICAPGEVHTLCHATDEGLGGGDSQ
jgi:hypothetical protein